MSDGLNIRKDGELDFLALGALVHRLDPGIIPFRKATECKIHVSGGEFNVAANLSDCFRHEDRDRLAPWSDYPIGDLIAERVRAMGVKPIYKHFEHNGVTGPNMATVYSDRGAACGRRWCSTTAPTKPRAHAEAGRLRLEGDLCRRRALGALRRHLCRAFAHHGASWSPR